MKLSNYITKERIIFDIEEESKEEIITSLSHLFYNDDSIISKEDEKKLTNDLIERERISSTGMQDGIAIPHTKASYIKKPAIALAICKEGKNFNSIDGKKSNIFFVIVAPEKENRIFIKLLSEISSISLEEDQVKTLLSLDDKDKIVDFLQNIGSDDE